MRQILITGDRSGSGKTSITLALAALLSRTYRVQTFKVGMDYIHPSYLAAVSGRPCRNLDSYTLSGSQVADIFRFGCRGADMAIVEGVRGLYEGAEALSDTGSTAAIAKTLDLPVILVVSATPLSFARSRVSYRPASRGFSLAQQEGHNDVDSLGARKDATVSPHFRCLDHFPSFNWIGERFPSVMFNHEQGAVVMDRIPPESL